MTYLDQLKPISQLEKGSNKWHILEYDQISHSTFKVLVIDDRPLSKKHLRVGKNYELYISNWLKNKISK